MPVLNLRQNGTELPAERHFHPIFQERSQARFAMGQVLCTQQNHALPGGGRVAVVAPVPTQSLQEGLFRALAEEAPQVIWCASTSGAVIYANRSWYMLVGGTPKDWMGSKWLQAVHPQDREDLLDNWQRCCQAREPYSGVRRILAMDGSYHTMSYKATPVLDEKGDVAFWVGIDTDISEIKATEAALRLSNEELVAFSYSVSHDLRSPLSTIDGFSRLLAKQLGSQVGDKVHHCLTKIEAGVTQMSRQIEDLLSLAQVSRTEFRHETINLSELSAQVLERHLSNSNGREVAVTITPGLLAKGDVRLVRIVLENLLGNAWKFTSRLSCAEISVGQIVGAEGESIFFVRDNGAGFNMARAYKLFKTCQRLHSTTEFPGTGIGLATVYRIVTRHGGKVWADSKPDKGATFFFTLPDR